MSRAHHTFTLGRAGRVAACLSVLAASLAFAVPSGAQTSLEQAKGFANRATVEYNVGHFDQALDLYAKAYEALPTPALLFDIGQCHRMLGNYERAVFFFEGYLRDKPDAQNRAVAEELLRDSQRKLDAQRAAAAEQHAATPSPTAVPSTAPEPVPVTTPTPAPTAPTPAPAGQPALRIAGIATAGAGVVAIVTAVALGLHASSASDEITQLSSHHGTWSPQYQSDYDSGKSAATAATVLYVTGGVLLAAGGVLGYLGFRKPADTRPVAAIAPAPGGASLVVAGVF